MGEVESIVSGGETSWIELMDEEKELKIGFHKKDDDRKGN